MTAKDIKRILNRANKLADAYEEKLNILNYDYFIISNIIFTSDVDYYYLFSVYKDNKPIEKIATYTRKEFIDVLKDLSTKYKTNVIYNYKDLNTNQLEYLKEQDDGNINQEELSNVWYKKQEDIDIFRDYLYNN